MHSTVSDLGLSNKKHSRLIWVNIIRNKLNLKLIQEPSKIFLFVLVLYVLVNTFSVMFRIFSTKQRITPLKI